MLLTFRIVTNASIAIYRQIIDQVRHGVATGSLRVGDQLPSVRGLAEHLAVNPNTVAKAYAELVRDGVVDSQHGKGFFIADRRQVFSQDECDRRLEQALNALLSEALVLNFTPDQIRRAVDRKLAEITAARSTEQRTES
ncbi:MAG: GntR family transcriptional regulator [Planctomycetes bacterium]|nr:GntR family transcriptional regulator [Planctomycetota bacterium]